MDSDSPSPAAESRQSTTLARGEACLVCRRRKLRCDGVRPSCGTCTRGGKAIDCEYADTRFLVTIRGLEDQVEALQSRVRELEGTSPPVVPSLPVARLDTSLPQASYSPASSSSRNLRVELLSIFNDPHGTGPQPSDLGLSTTLAPSTTNSLIEIFLPHAPQFGLPSGTTADVLLVTAPAVLEATFAIACHFAPPACVFLRAFERAFAQRAEAALPHAGVLHAVQTHSILGMLAFLTARTMEGHRHAGAASRLAFALNLHSLQAHDTSERLETWWMVYRLDRAWSPVLRLPVLLPTDPAISSAFLAGETGYIPLGVQHLSLAPSYGIDYFGETKESLLTKSLALHACAQPLLNTLSAGTPMPEDFWQRIRTLVAALDRLASALQAVPQNTSARIIAHGCLACIHHRLGACEPAVTAACTVAATLGSIPEAEYVLLHPVVAIYVREVQQCFGSGNESPSLHLRELAMLGLAMQRLVSVFPYVTS